MTAFYKIVDSGYISGIGTNGSDSVTAITGSEYNAIMQKIQSKPTDPEGYQYKLRADLISAAETLIEQRIKEE